MLLIISAVLTIITIVYYFKKKSNYWTENGVKQMSAANGFLLFYHMLFPKKSTNELMQDLYKKYPNERYVGMYQFLKPVLFLRDIDLIKRLIIRDADSFADHQTISDEEIDPLWSRNLVASTGETWHRMRTTLSPSFTSSKMKMMFGLMDDCADQFIQYFLEQAKTDKIEVQEMDIKKMFTRFTNDVIATCAFGISCDSLRNPDNEFYVKGLDATNFGGWRLLKFMLYPLCPSLMKFLNIKIINDDVGDFFRKIVRDTIEMREKENIVRPDMIQLMMDMRKKLGKDKLDDDDLTAQVLIFFLAGFETTAILMAFVAYELAVNPDMQERLKKEIDSTLAKSDGKVTYDALMSMKYLDMFINETLRRWPPSPITDRLVTKDYYIEPERPDEVGFYLKKGHLLNIPMDCIMQDPNVYPNPTKFDPERFNDENKTQSNNAFLPFGVGPRMCIGSRFALTETKVIIIKLMQHFEFVPVAKTNIPMVLEVAQISTYSKGGWWLGLKLR